MKVKVFSIPATGDEVAEAAVNLFVAQHRTAQIDRQLIQNGAASFWTICVGYFDQQQSQAASTQKSSRVDYRAILSADDFRDYSALREWRKGVSDREGIPAYGVFTNDQLSKIVRLQQLTKTQLATIDGIGEKKCERYAEEVLAYLEDRRSQRELPNDLPETRQGTSADKTNHSAGDSE